ncbi:hypothetical protein A2G06_16460 (plasmid) [Geobacter anodireducens]|nr:hypothetical protein A2G06_16460 [Geobacter anodireducens]
MTKQEIAQRLFENGLGSQSECRKLVDSAFELFKNAIAREGELKISGFGVFLAKSKHPRKGRNPQTGEEITIDGRRVVSFKPSPILRKSMNAHSHK